MLAFLLGNAPEPEITDLLFDEQLVMLIVWSCTLN